MPAAMSRRAFLLAGGGALALAACSSGSGTKAGGSTTTAPSGSTEPPAKWTLVGFFASDALAPGAPVRLPFGIAAADGGLPAQPPVSSLSVTVVDSAGKPLGLPETVAAHSEGLTRAYFPVTFTPPAAGIYTVRSSIEGVAVERAVQIDTGGTVPQAGAAMIPFDTPTSTDPKGVELLCTRDPACPLHEVTLTQALTEQRPLAFLIATPRFCQTAICGPVLDVLLGAQAQFPQVRFLHSEVYPSVAAAQPNAFQTVPVVQAYGLSFEPVLFLATPDGKVQRRLDTIYDAAELRSALTTLVG